MTKSKGIGRGGARPGSGRPREVREHVAPLPKPIADAKDLKAEAARQRTIRAFEAANIKSATPMSVQELAQSYTELAVETLAEIALAGDKDAARVAAANSLVKIAQGAGGAAGKDEADAPGKPAAADSWDALLQ